MHTRSIDQWQHDHAFGQDKPRPGERATRLVIALTGITMVVEIAAGLAFGSMALLADGLHMASHCAALVIAAFAYWYARRQAHNPAFSFGTGKVNALGGFASAILLTVFALLMAWESVWRFVEPVPIAFDQAILVAVLGLAVNAVSAALLGSGNHAHGHHHAHGPHNHDHHGHAHRHEDHNLRAAYVHVLADALTSVLAIIALLAGRFLGLVWMDPMMGLVGALLVTIWAVGLMRQSTAVLLDRQAPAGLIKEVRAAVEGDSGSDRVTDLHVWSIGPGIYAALLAVISDKPLSADDYRAKLPHGYGLVHVHVEVRQCPHEIGSPESSAKATFSETNRE